MHVLINWIPDAALRPVQIQMDDIDTEKAILDDPLRSSMQFFYMQHIHIIIYNITFLFL
jgi:hypothetical protein